MVPCSRVLQRQRQRRRAGASVQCLEGAQPSARVSFDIGQADFLPCVDLAPDARHECRQGFFARRQEQQPPACRLPRRAAACRPRLALAVRQQVGRLAGFLRVYLAQFVQDQQAVVVQRRQPFKPVRRSPPQPGIGDRITPHGSRHLQRRGLADGRAAANVKPA